MNQDPTCSEEVFDGRDIPCRVKHGLIIQRCVLLDVGASFILVNDHDPVPLRYQLYGEFPDCFRWDYVENGPEVFRVRITKLAEPI
jgi:uncharacterized protein (DUF2249 family)